MPSHHRVLGRKSKERDARTLRPLLYKATVPVGASVGDHGLLTGLADDDHTQYAGIAQTETITGKWTHQNDVRVTDGYQIELGTSGPIYLGRYSDTDIGIHGGFRSISPDWINESTGWHISYDGEADFRRIFADELHVRAFIADIEQALAGGQIISKSVAILSRDFTAPASIDGTATLYVEDLPGFANTQSFEAGDYVRMRYIDRSGGGLVVSDIWGIVTVYTDLSGGEQSWVFTLKQGTGSVTIYAGAIVLDYGTSGQGYHEITTIDTKFSPYAQIVTWATNPWTPGNRTLRTRIGQLDGVTDTDLYPSGWGLYATNAFLKGKLWAANGQVKIDDDGIIINPGVDSEHKITWVGSDSNEYAQIGFGETVADDFWAFHYAVSNNTSQKAHLDLGAFTANYDMQIVIDADDVSDYARARFVFNSTNELLRVANDGITIYEDITPGTHNTYSIGTDSVRIKDLYVVNLYATNSSTGEELSGQSWSYPGDMNIYPDYDSAHTVVSIINRDGTYQADLYVERNITLGGTVDGVDIASFKSSYDSHTGNANAHHNRSHSIIGASDHTLTGDQYNVVGLSATDTIGVLVSSDNPGANIRILRSTAAGGLTLETLTVNQSVGFDSLVVQKSGTFNESGGDYDFRVEGDSQVNLFFVDASTNRIGINTNAPAKKLEVIDTAGAQLRLSHTAGSYYADFLVDSSGNLIVEAIASIVINDAGDEKDFRVEGGTLANLLLVDGSADMVGINTAAPTRRLDILDASNPQLRLTRAAGTHYADLQVDGSGNLILTPVANMIVNEAGADTDFRAEGTSNTHLLFADAGQNRVGINISTPAAKLHVLQGSTPQLRLGYNVDNYADFNISSGGNLTLKPTGDLVLDPTGNDVLPEQAYDINLGALNKKYLTLHAAELWVETLVAQETIATIGGRILVGPTSSLTDDLLISDITMELKHNQVDLNDILYLEAGGKVEFIKPVGVTVTGISGASDYFQFSGDFTAMLTAGRKFRITGTSGAYDGVWTVVSSSYDGGTSTTTVYVSEDVPVSTPKGAMLYWTENETTGPYIYTIVTRDLDGSGQNDWYAGDAVFNTGTDGDGFIDLYSVSSVKGGTQYGPTIVGNVRNTETYNDWTEHWAIGNLNGLYGYGSNTYGVGLGRYTANHITIDATNGIRFKDSTGAILGSLSSTTWTLGKTDGQRITLSSGAMEVYDSGNNRRLRLDDGTSSYMTVWRVPGIPGSSGVRSLIVNDSGAFFGNYDDATVANRSYVLIDTSANIKFYGGNNQRGQISSNGDFWFGDTTSGKANMYWQTSTGTLGFRAGTGTVQAYINTTGAIMAGGGSVNIDADGIELAAPSTFAWPPSASSITFATAIGGTAFGQLGAAYSSDYAVWLEAYASIYPKLFLRANSTNANGNSEVHIEAENGSRQVSIDLVTSDGSGDYMLLTEPANKITLQTPRVVFNQLGSDGSILELQSSDVVHGMTDIADTNTYGVYKKLDGNYGGLYIGGYSETSLQTGVAIVSVAGSADTTISTSGRGVTRIYSAIKSGTTSQALGTNGNLLSVENRGTTRLIVDAEGDLYIDGTSNTYDDHNDIELIRGFEQHMINRAEIVDQKFREWLGGRKSELQEIGILSKTPGSYFYNVTRLQRLQNGALWQLHERLERLEKILSI